MSKILPFIVAVGLLSVGFATDSSIDSFPNPDIQEFQNREERAQKILSDLDNQIDWYLTTLYPKEWSSNPELGQEAQDIVAKSEALKEELQKLQEAFLTFRNRLENCHLLCPDAAYNGLADATSAIEQLTIWYASHIQNKFFPLDWQKEYEASPFFSRENSAPNSPSEN